MSITKLSVPLKEALGYYNEGTTIPANTNTDGATNLESGKTNGQLEIVLAAATEIAVADTKTVTLSYSSSVAVAGTFVTHGTTLVLMTADTTYAVGEVIASIIIPNDVQVLEFTKVNVATDDAGATGTYNVFLRRVVN